MIDPRYLSNLIAEAVKSKTAKKKVNQTLKNRRFFIYTTFETTKQQKKDRLKNEITSRRP